MKKLERFFYFMAVRCVKLPGVKQTLKTSMVPLQAEEPSRMNLNEAECILGELPARPSGHAYWVDKEQPEWGCGSFDLSVIIPFYNTEQYARECIESVLRQQTDYRFEVILVDDGSPDSCGRIIDQYRSRPNIQVIHKSNGGLSEARNVGIKQARGKYLMFVDSDDWICAGAIQALLSTAMKHEADIVDGSFITTTKNGKQKRYYSHPYKVGSLGEGMYGYAWGKVIKRELFSKVCFPAGFWSEDIICAHILFPMAKKSVTIPDVISMYRTNPKGISESCATNPKCIDKLYVIQETIETILKLDMDLTQRRDGLLWELGPSLYGRIHGLEEKQLEAAFVYAAELAEQYALIDENKECSFYEKEYREALKNKQFGRWKRASFLM